MQFTEPKENLPVVSTKRTFYPPVKQEGIKLKLISVIYHGSPGRRANPDDLGENLDVFA